MQTPLKYSYTETTNKFKSFKFDLNKFIQYSIYIVLSILIGSFLKLISTINRHHLGKSSYLTGIPLLRDAFFLFPILFSVFCGLLIAFKIITTIRSNDRLKLLKKAKCGFFLTNVVLFIIFDIFYNQLAKPLNKSHEFKLSGHIFAALFSGCIMTNCQTVFDKLIEENYNTKYMTYAKKTCFFLNLHSIYCIFWTSWLFHPIRETLFAFIFGFIAIILINHLEIEGIFLTLFESDKVVTKSKDIICTNTNKDQMATD
jgi:hypothetical protein